MFLTKPNPELSPDELAARAAEARALLKNKVLDDAFEELAQLKVHELMSVQVGTSQAVTAHAILRALGELRGVLQNFADATIDTRRRK